MLSVCLSSTIYLLTVCNVSCCAMQVSAESVKKDVFFGKVADLSMEKQQWIENRLHSISELMKKTGKLLEVSYLSGSF